jgi:hypothetical protein
VETAAKRKPKEVEAAKAAVASAEKELHAIEEEALEHTNSELAGHLDPLAKQRALIKQGTNRTTVGEQVTCDAVKAVPKNVRNMDFAELEKALAKAGKAKPDTVIAAGKPAGGGKATGHQRLEYEFKDGSRLVVDLPRELGGRAKSADMPHVEVHGPKGQRLDPQGIVVPEASIAAHMTITDNLRVLEHYFAPARAGK